MKKKMKKLQLNKETLRNLNSTQLEAAVGASLACTLGCTWGCSGAQGCAGTNNCTTHEN